MQISVQFPDYEAITDDERDRVHTRGQYTGTFFNSYYFVSESVVKEDGTRDFTDSYIKCFSELFKVEPRVAAGKQYRIDVIA